jgi:cytochrome c
MGRSEHAVVHLRRLAVAVPVMISAMLGAAVSRAEHAGQQGVAHTENISVWDGVYSEAQAERGRDVYQHVCTSCHHGELQGDRGMGAPALSGDVFFANWNTLTLEALFDKIFRTMPYEEPETLNPYDAVDLVAYILQFNTLPPGEVELSAEPGRLGRIVIEETNPRSLE